VTPTTSAGSGRNGRNFRGSWCHDRGQTHRVDRTGDHTGQDGEEGEVRRSPEKRVQWQIIRALQALGCDVTSTSQPQRAMMTPGIPDLYIRHPRWGIRLWVEVKAGRNRATPAQRAWIDAELEAGGHAIVAYGVEDVLRELIRLGAPIEAHGLGGVNGGKG